MQTTWPSGLRRYVQVVVSQGAWVRIPLLSSAGDLPTKSVLVTELGEIEAESRELSSCMATNVSNWGAISPILPRFNRDYLAKNWRKNARRRQEKVAVVIPKQLHTHKSTARAVWKSIFLFFFMVSSGN